MAIKVVIPFISGINSTTYYTWRSNGKDLEIVVS